jgi:hypothetical protein
MLWSMSWTIAAIGGGLMVIAALAYFIAPIKQVKVSAIVMSTLGGLTAGAVLGLMGAIVFGDQVYRETYSDRFKPDPMPGTGGSSAKGYPTAAGGIMKKAGGGGAPKKKASGDGGGGGGGGGRGGRGGGPQGPTMGAEYITSVMRSGRGGMNPFGGPPPENPKDQLTALVNKLDELTRKPLSVSLSDEQKAKVKDQLQGLADVKELTLGDAKKRLDALLDVLKDKKETLAAAGFRWPGEKENPAPAGDSPNPFSSDANGGHLKALMGTLGDAKK